MKVVVVAAFTLIMASACATTPTESAPESADFFENLARDSQFANKHRHSGLESCEEDIRHEVAQSISQAKEEQKSLKDAIETLLKEKLIYATLKKKSVGKDCVDPCVSFYAILGRPAYVPLRSEFKRGDLAEFWLFNTVVFFTVQSDICYGIAVPRTFITDMASIPKGMRNKYNPSNYVVAATFHDYLFARGNSQVNRRNKKAIDKQRGLANRVFFEALLLSGAGDKVSKELYDGLTWAGRFGSTGYGNIGDYSFWDENVKEKRTKMAPDTYPNFAIEDYKYCQSVASRIEQLSETVRAR